MEKYTQDWLSPNTIEDVQTYMDYLSVGTLLDQLSKALEEGVLTKDAKVCVERVPDRYFKGERGWATIKKPDLLDPEFMDEYHPAWSITESTDEDVLYVNMHY